MNAISLVAGASLVLAPLASLSSQQFGTQRQQAATQQGWLEKRMKTVLPPLMRKHGIDMWVLPMREYNEDPVFWSIVSPTTMAARRRTIYAFCDRGPQLGVERIAIGVALRVLVTSDAPREPGFGWSLQGQVRRRHGVSL